MRHFMPENGIPRFPAYMPPRKRQRGICRAGISGCRGRDDPQDDGRLSPFHRTLRLSAALRAQIGDVVQLLGDWRAAVGLHRLFAAGTSDDGQGFWRFDTHFATGESKLAGANSSFAAVSSNYRCANVTLCKNRPCPRKHVAQLLDSRCTL
jgi:hypothetical protein